MGVINDTNNDDYELDSENESDDETGGDSSGGQSIKGLLDNSDQRKNRVSFSALDRKDIKLKSVWIKNVVDTRPLVIQGRLDPAQLPPAPPPPMPEAKIMVSVNIRPRSMGR